MNSIILYTTKYGCTEKVANKLKANMRGNVKLINLMLETAPSLKDYDQVLIGGSIYYGAIQKELTNFVHSALPELLEKKVGLFICAGATDVKEREQVFTKAFPKELLEHATRKEVLGQAYDFDRMTFFEKIICRVVSGTKTSTELIPEATIQQYAQDFVSA